MAGKKRDDTFLWMLAAFGGLMYLSRRSRPIVPFGDPKVTILRAQYPTMYLATKKDGKKVVIWNQELADAIERGEIKSYEKYDIKKH